MTSHARQHPRRALAGPRPVQRPPRLAEGAARRRLATLGTLLPAFTALPAAVLVVPDVSGNVVPAAASALALGDAEVPGLLRATGLSLPALLVTVPLAAVAARRFPAWSVLMAGLAVLVAGIGAARLAHSLPAVGAVRTLQGAGAGAVLPASLVLVWERRNRALTAAWAGALAGTLILAMPLALRAVPVPAEGTAAHDWRAALAPSPLPAAAVAAAGAALVHPFLRGRRRRPPAGPRRAECGRLLLVLVPAGGFAFLAVVAAHGWSPGARLLVAGLTLLALAGLAFAGGRDAALGGPPGGAAALIAAGMLCLPVAGPLAGLSAARTGAGGPPLLPFAVAAAAAVAAALAATRAGTRRAVLTGHLLMAVAMPLGLAGGVLGRWALLAPLVPLGAGAGLVLAASLRDAKVGSALFGLSLCFPAALAGQLLVLSLQAARLERLHPVTDAEQAHALLEGYRVWLALAGGVAVLLALATARLGAGRAARLPANAAARPGAG